MPDTAVKQTYYFEVHVRGSLFSRACWVRQPGDYTDLKTVQQAAIDNGVYPYRIKSERAG